MVDVKEILSLPVLRRLKIIAGEKGLNKRVSSLTVMEVPDIDKWLKGYEFVLTSLYAFKDDINLQIKLIDTLADANCSCVGIKLGQYVKELDPSIIQRANDRGLVLVEIPREITYIELIINGMEKILHDRDIDNMIEKYMKDIIFDNYESDEIAIERGVLLGIRVKENYCLAITLVNEDSEADKVKLRKIAKSVAKKSDMILKYTYNPVVTVSNKSSIILFSIEEQNIKNNLDKIINLVEEYLKKESLNKVKIAVGSLEKGLTGIRETYSNSLEVLNLKTMMNNNSSVYRYDDLKIYITLEDFLKSDNYKEFDDIIGKINEDLLLTIETFYKYNMDIIATSKALFIHQNTVRYRLTKIKEITGYDTYIFENNFKLYLLLFYIRIKNNKYDNK